LNPLGSRRGGGPHRPALPDLDLRSARRIGNVAGAQHHDTGHAQLGQDPGDMDAGRLGGDEQLLADLAVGPPSGDQRQDLGLPRLR
jgi:hypothetical protein